MTYEILISIVSILFGMCLVIFNKKMAILQKNHAEKKEGIVSDRMKKYSLRDVRLLSVIVGLVFLLFGAIGLV